MENWALEAYGVAYTLEELLTVKSDDVVDRVKTSEAIVMGEDVIKPGVSESFMVLISELYACTRRQGPHGEPRDRDQDPRRRHD